MPVISVYKIEVLKDKKQVLDAFSEFKPKEGWFLARPSKFSKYEVFIQYFYYESLEQHLKRFFPESDDIVSILKKNGKTKVLKRVICFISLLTKTLEIYRGPDKITNQIAEEISKALSVELKPLKLTPEQLQKLYEQHGIELKQALFKHVDGLMYEILRGQNLEANKKFRSYLQKFKDCLRVISFRPNIRYLNGGKYQVTINGDKGTLRFSDVDGFKWRPRVEIRQLIFLMAATAGWLR